MDKWVTDNMHDVSKFLSRIAAYRELLPLLFAFNLQNYSRYLTYHHFEFQALKHKHFSAYEQLKIYEMGASLTERKFLNIPEDLVTVVTASREVKIPGGPVQDGYSTFVEAVDGFILNKHTLGKLWRALKKKVNVKASNNHKEFSRRQKKIHEQYIQQLLGTIPVDPFDGPAQSIMSDLLMTCWKPRKLVRNFI